MVPLYYSFLFKNELYCIFISHEKCYSVHYEFESPTSAAAMEVVVGGQCAAAAAGVLLALCCAAEANWNAADPEAEAAAVLEVVAVEAVADDEDVVAVEEEDCNARTRGLEGSCQQRCPRQK